MALHISPTMIFKIWEIWCEGNYHLWNFWNCWV